jgi:isopentenyldiphosphate isomerase
MPLSTEWIDVIGGGIKTKPEVHRDGDWHVAAHVWIVTPDRRGVLLQLRSSEKENWPGWWDVSSAGHVTAGESAIDAAVRETREELGLAIAHEELQHIGSAREECVLNDGAYIDREVHEIFVVEREVDLAALVLQPGEVDEVKLVPIDALATIERLVPHEVEYRLLRDWCYART